MAARRRARRGRALAPLVRRFNLPRHAFDALVDGVAMDVGSRRYETFEDLYLYCTRVASAVGLMCVEIFGYSRSKGEAVRDRPRRRAAAHQHPARRAGGSVAWPGLHPAGGPPALRVQRRGFETRDSELPARVSVAGGEVAAAASGRPRPRLLRARGGVPSCRRRTATRGRRDHGSDLLRDPEAHRGGRLRRLLPRDPDPPSSPRADRPENVGEGPWGLTPIRDSCHSNDLQERSLPKNKAGGTGVRPPVVIGGGFAGLSAAAFLADRGVPAIVLDARPRLGGRATAFRGSRHRRVGRQRPARVCSGATARRWRFWSGSARPVTFACQDALEIPFLDASGRRSAPVLSAAAGAVASARWRAAVGRPAAS